MQTLTATVAEHEMSGWQPIAIAPMDPGTIYLIVSGGIVWCAKRYSKDDERWFDLDGNVDLEHPTHWMALPAPPEFGRNHG